MSSFLSSLSLHTGHDHLRHVGQVKPESSSGGVGGEERQLSVPIVSVAEDSVNDSTQ